METIFYVNNQTLIAALSGEIDHHVCDKLRKDIDEEMTIYGAKNLIFDFSDVTFMDSSGIGMVLGRYKKVKQMGGHVIIRNASRIVKQILDMSGVFTLMNYEETEEQR
ncbi:MAG: anti-sigma F factor antagonist [Firmicutes bacterium]|nr:anti-sigma F factor antagonist [Bacillota bacterium]